MSDLGVSISNTGEVENLDAEKRAAIAVSALSNLGPEKQQETLQQAGVGVAGADQVTSNAVWIRIVSSFAIVLVISVLTISVIALGFLGNTDIQTVLTVFTTAAGFLAGLLSPSPLATGR